MKITLGKTGLVINKNGFGALPLQRCNFADASAILKAAFNAGINFFDTARGYTDSEEKMGLALSSVREKFVLATKTPATSGENLRKDLETSLRLLKTDYIDIYQFHNPKSFPKPDDGTGLYGAALTAKKEGKIRFIGITNHRLAVAVDAVKSGLFDTMQFPFSYISNEKESCLVRLCEEKNVGFIAMKALSGGLLNDVYTAAAFMNTQKYAAPIWGIQTLEELDKLLDAIKNEQGLTQEQKERIEKDRTELVGEFCRSCGYCLPCPQDILIPNCARMMWLLRRMPAAIYLTAEWQAEMKKTTTCQNCGDCKSRCPYGLDIPAMLKKNYADYQTFL